MKIYFLAKNFLKARDSYAKNITMLAGSTALTQIIMLVFSPILTRIYSPEDFGILGFYSSILSILAILVTLRFELVLNLPSSKILAINALALSVISTFIMCSLIFITIAWMFLSNRDDLAFFETLGVYWFLIPLGLCGLGLYNAFNYWAIRKENFKIIAKTKIDQCVLQIAVQVSAGFAFHGPFGLLLGQIASQTSGVGRLFYQMWKNDGYLMKYIRIKNMILVIKRYKKFPTISVPSGLINSAGIWLPTILFSLYYGNTVAGFYLLAHRIISLPMMVLGKSVSQVYFSKASKLANRNSSEFQKFFKSTIKILALIGVPLITVVGFISPWIFPFVFGSQWAEAGIYALLLAPNFIGGFVASTISQTVYIVEKNEYQLIWDCLRLIVVIISIAVPSEHGLSARDAVVIFSGSMFSLYMMLIFLNLYFVGKFKGA